MKSILARNPLLLLLVTGALAAACGTTSQPTGGTPTASAAAPTSSEPLVVRAFGTRVSPEGKTPLKQNGIVKSGDSYSLKLDLSRPAFVYLLQFKSDGTADVLYPSGGDPRDARKVHDIPGEPGVVLRLDNVTGTEMLFLVVSERPIEEAAPEVVAILREIETLPAGSVLPFTVETEETVAAADMAKAPVEVAKPDPEPPPPKLQGSCPPVTLRKDVKATARGCPGAQRADVKVTARGTRRERAGDELVHAVADAGGVVSYAIQLDHQ